MKLCRQRWEEHAQFVVGIMIKLEMSAAWINSVKWRSFYVRFRVLKCSFKPHLRTRRAESLGGMTC